MKNIHTIVSIIISALIFICADNCLSQKLVSHSASEETHLIVIIPLISTIQVVASRDRIIVTDKNIKKGYLNIPDAVTLRFRCNSEGEVSVEGLLLEDLLDNNGHKIPSGCLLFRTPDSKDYLPFDATSRKIFDLKGNKGEQEIKMDLRLVLPPDTEPGDYYFYPSFNLVAL